MYNNNKVNFQESTTILNACTKKVWKLIEYTTYMLNVWYLALFIKIAKYIYIIDLCDFCHPLCD